MTDILHNLSGKIEQSFVEALQEIKKIAGVLHLDFFVVGALARDIVMGHLYGLPSRRLTRDIDLAVCVASWEEYGVLTDSLLSSGRFFKGNQKQRFVFSGRDEDRIIDVIPFGDISDHKSRVYWPPDQETVLTTLGFVEVHQNATTFRLAEDPVLDVKVPTIPGLALLKLIAWNEGYPNRGRDAEDLIFMMGGYHKAGIEERLYGPESALLEEEGFDIELAGIRLLGRDMAKLSSPASAGAIAAILNEETGENAKFKLVNQMVGTHLDVDSRMLRLERLKQGFYERC